MILGQKDWVRTNIEERRKNKSLFFDGELGPEPFTRKDFKTACEDAAWNLTVEGWGPLYLALSGGLDSTHVLETFARLDLEINPVIVIIHDAPTWMAEARHGLLACSRLGIIPHVINISMAQLLYVFEKQIVDGFNGMGVWSTPSVIVASYVKPRGGFVITGENIFDQGELVMNEYDYYVDALAPFCPFYMYDPAILHASLTEADWSGDEGEVKSKLYDMPAQGVQVHTFPTKELYEAYQRIKDNVTDHPRFYKKLGTHTDMLKLLDRLAL